MDVHFAFPARAEFVFDNFQHFRAAVFADNQATVLHDFFAKK